MKALLTAAVLFATPGLALAEEWTRTAQGELRFVELTLANGGWTLEREIHAEGLASGETGYTSLRLAGRSEYAIVALCDRDCGDVDLAIYENDVLAAEDCTESGLPLVTVTAQERTTFDTEVRMFNCARETCRYSVAVFSRPAPTAFTSR